MPFGFVRLVEEGERFELVVELVVLIDKELHLGGDVAGGVGDGDGDRSRSIRRRG